MDSFSTVLDYWVTTSKRDVEAVDLVCFFTCKTLTTSSGTSASLTPWLSHTSREKAGPKTANCFRRIKGLTTVLLLLGVSTSKFCSGY